MEKIQDYGEKNERVQKQINRIMKESEFAIPFRLQDSAQVLLDTKTIKGKAFMKCRKLDLFGDAGEITFEQPSIKQVESGLWKGNAAI